MTGNSTFSTAWYPGLLVLHANMKQESLFLAREARNIVSVTCYGKYIMRHNQNEDWAKLWKSIVEIAKSYPESVVFIGGVAVYIHVSGAKDAAGFIETSHDADFYISLADFADLRDVEEVTANRRLNKYQIVKDGLEYDIYLEHNNALAVPYHEVFARSTVIEGIRVACLEHLVVLKLNAWQDRRGSAKGRKDERDLIKLCWLMAKQGFDAGLVRPYLTAEQAGLLSNLPKSPEFLAVTSGNMHAARPLREACERVAKELAKPAKPVKRPKG